MEMRSMASRSAGACSILSAALLFGEPQPLLFGLLVSQRLAQVRQLALQALYALQQLRGRLAPQPTGPKG
jgi:hypothetical protein